MKGGRSSLALAFGLGRDVVSRVRHLYLFLPSNLYSRSVVCTTLRRIVPSRQHLQHLECQIRAGTASPYPHQSEEARSADAPNRTLAVLAGRERLNRPPVPASLYQLFGPPEVSGGDGRRSPGDGSGRVRMYSNSSTTTSKIGSRNAASHTLRKVCSFRAASARRSTSAATLRPSASTLGEITGIAVHRRTVGVSNLHACCWGQKSPETRARWTTGTLSCPC